MVLVGFGSVEQNNTSVSFHQKGTLKDGRGTDLTGTLPFIEVC